MATLGERVRARREVCGLSLSDLARASGVSRNYLHLIETGASDPTVTVALKIADALGVTLNALAYDANMPEDAIALRKRLDAIRDALHTPPPGSK